MSKDHVRSTATHDLVRPVESADQVPARGAGQHVGPLGPHHGALRLPVHVEGVDRPWLSLFGNRFLAGGVCFSSNTEPASGPRVEDERRFRVRAPHATALTELANEDGKRIT